MFKRIKRETLSLSILLFAMSACQNDSTKPPQKPSKAKPQSAESDDADVNSTASGSSGGAGLDDDRILFLAPFRLPLKELPHSKERVEMGAELCRGMLKSQKDSLSLAQGVVSHGPSALHGFMTTARSSKLTVKQAQQILTVLAYMPEVQEKEELYQCLQPTVLGRQAEQQLLSMNAPALRFLLEKVDADPSHCPAPTFRICKKLLADADSAEINTFLMRSQGPGRWDLLELALSVRSRIAERRIKESLFFGSIPERLKAIQVLRASPEPMFQDFLRTQLDFTVASNDKENLALKVEAIRTLAQFRDFKVIPKLMSILKNDKTLGYECLKALKIITRKQHSKAEWFEWWEEYETVHANIERYRIVALSPRMASPTRISAIRKLGQFYDYSISTTFVALFIDLDEEVQLEAIRQSANCNADDVIPSLIRLLDHKRDPVVRAAHLALQRVTKQKFGRSKAAWQSYLKSKEADL